MTSVRKLCVMLAAIFGLTFAASGVALAASAALPASGSASPVVQAGAEGGVDCDEQPDHPDCQENDDWR